MLSIKQRDILSMNKGFTLIEVLVSLVILSLIGLICSQILSSALESEEISTKKLNELKELSLSSSIIRRDLRQAVNVPSRDYYGDPMPGTFYYDELSNSIIFNTSIKNLSLVTSNINRVQYMIEDNALKRKQYFSSNPYNEEDNTETNLVNNVEDIEFTFMHQMRWHDRWPLDEATANKFPELIRIDFSVGSSDYFWLIDPNIEYAYEG